MSGVAGRRRVAMIGFALLPLRGLVLSFTDNIALFLCMQLLEACGSAIVGVVAIIMVHDLTTGKIAEQIENATS